MKKDDSPNEAKAKEYFLKGVELERIGNYSQAVTSYKKAFHLAPDIESTLALDTAAVQGATASHSIDGEIDLEKSKESDVSSTFDPKCTEPLLDILRDAYAKSGILITPNVSAKGRHISELPFELLLNIFRWVVSSQLNMRTLDVCSRTCRGFYICAKDPSLWKNACYRIWGAESADKKYVQYESWRRMYLERPRVHTDGCYISKICYFREGERCFQDATYPPFHMVIFYRYIRFYPNKTALMLVTSRPPQKVVKSLHWQHASALKGTYSYGSSDGQLTAKFINPQIKWYGKEDPNSKRYVEIQLDMSVYARRGIHKLKKERCYSSNILQKNGENPIVVDRDESAKEEPALIFSRVLSYDAPSANPL